MRHGDGSGHKCDAHDDGEVERAGGVPGLRCGKNLAGLP